MDFDFGDVLEKRLKHVNDWLQFAEKKNATLIALDLGVIWGISRLLDLTKIGGATNLLLLSIGGLLVMVSIFVCLFSFLPILQKSDVVGKLKKSSDDNSLFFGDIAKYDSNEYLQLLLLRYGMENYKVSHAHKDYSEQIVTNSKIAKHKLDVFRVSAWFTFFGFLTLILFVVIFLFKG